MDRPVFIPNTRRRPAPKGPEAWGVMLHRPLHESITEVHEGALVARLLADPHHQHTLFNVKGLNFQEATVLREEPLRTLRHDLTGDVDILVVPHGHPEQATAIQVKRFKAVCEADGTREQDAEAVKVLAGRMERLFAKGVEQVKVDACEGFSQVYLWVFVMIDSRKRNGARYAHDGGSIELTSRISEIISTGGLPGQVGLMRFEWMQPIDRPPFELGTHGGHLVRAAGTVTQPERLTRWIESLVQTR